MEITLEALEALFDRATITSSWDTALNYGAGLHTFISREGLEITVRDADFNDILTIHLPVSTRTIVSF